MSRFFFYGLFMDRSLLAKKGLDPQVIGPAVLRGYRIHIGARATLQVSPPSRVLGIVMELSEEDARALYSEPSVREYQPERVQVEMLHDGAVLVACCYNLPSTTSVVGANPAYAVQLAGLVEVLLGDAAYAREIAAFATQAQA